MIERSPTDQVSSTGDGGYGGGDDGGHVNDLFRLLRSFIRLDCDEPSLGAELPEPSNMRELPRGADLCAMERWIN